MLLYHTAILIGLEVSTVLNVVFMYRNSAVMMSGPTVLFLVVA